MKKILISTFILIIMFIFLVPKYNELNNITIIDSIGIEKNNNNYIIYFREVIPVKIDNGLKYNYKIYNIKTSKLDKAVTLFEKKQNKKLYLDKVKFLITNTSSDYIKSKININPKIIYHSNNVQSKLSTQ